MYYNRKGAAEIMKCLQQSAFTGRINNMKNSKEKFMQKTIVVWMGALICCALWGSAFPSIKIGYGMLQILPGDTGSQILFAGYRFVLAGILVILIGSLINRKLLIPKKDSWTKILKLSFLQTVAQYIFFYIGLANTSGVKASIIIGVNVFIAILVASLIFRQEKLTVPKISGCAVGFTGVLLVNITGSQIDMSFSFLGEGFIFLSTIAYAFSSVFMKRYSKDEDPLVLSGYQFVAGGIVLSAAGFLSGGSVGGFSASGIIMLIYLALISAVAYSLWGVLLKYNDVSKVAVFGFMNPVFGVILSAVFLGEKEQASGWTSLAALVLVCTGIYIVNRSSIGKGSKNVTVHS
nr:DMT family transporter [Anaerobium acetethylicum]